MSLCGIKRFSWGPVSLNPETLVAPEAKERGEAAPWHFRSWWLSSVRAPLTGTSALRHEGALGLGGFP